MNVLSVLTFDPSKHPHARPETVERVARLVQEMRAEGALVDTGGRVSAMLELSVTRNDGRTTVTDGPFAESKEVVGGFAQRFLGVLGSDATCTLHEVTSAPT